MSKKVLVLVQLASFVKEKWSNELVIPRLIRTCLLECIKN